MLYILGELTDCYIKVVFLQCKGEKPFKNKLMYPYLLHMIYRITLAHIFKTKVKTTYSLQIVSCMKLPRVL